MTNKVARQRIGFFLLFALVLVLSERVQANPGSLLELSFRTVQEKVLNEIVPYPGSDLQEYQNLLQNDPDLTLKVKNVLLSSNLPEDLLDRFFEKKIQIAAGSAYSVLLTQEHKVISFGFAGYGQLGHGNELSQKFPKTIETKELKNEIVVQVAAGDDHTLLLTEKGEVLSFGNGHCGQLGHGDWHNFSIPKKIETDLLKNQRVVQIATGADFSLLLTETGRVLSFGQGFFGNLGIGNERNRSSPVFIEAEELKNQKVIRIAAGSSHSLLLTDRGNIYSFGSGIYGQLGHGDEQNQSIPKMMDSEALKGEKIVQIEAGGGYSLLLTEDGGVFSFGLGAHGRLGHGDEQSVSTPKRIESDALLGYRIVQVAAGASHSLLLTESGDVFSFGHGGAGRLGHGDTQDQWIPKLIDPNSFRGRKIKQIAAGGDHSLAVSEEGIVFSFGEGRHGALGLKENSARQSVPQEIKMGWIWSPHQYHLFRPFNSSERF